MNSKYININIIISSFISIFIPLLYIKFLGTDNVATFYYDAIQSQTYWLGQYENYRYVPAAIGLILYNLNFGYYDFIYVWSFLFSAGIIFCSYEFQKYADLPKSCLPFIVAAVSLNGYMADLYAFSMVFSAYGIAYFGVALALRSLRRIKGMLGVAGASVAIVIVCSSYQVTVLIVLFAVAVKLINGLLNQGGMPALSVSLRNIASFVMGILGYLTLKAIIGPNYGRDVTLKYMSNNLQSYLEFIPSMLFNGVRGFNSLFELYFYLLCLTVIAITCIIHIYIRPGMHSIIAMMAFVCSLLIIACPFTLMPEGFWPAPRQMTASTFFFVGCAVVCYSLAKPFLREILSCFSIVFIAYSLFFQIEHFAFMKGQDERDALAVQLITADIAKIITPTPETKLSVVSTSKTPINSNYRMSAFNEPWSHGTIFRVLTGNFYEVEKPDGACDTLSDKAWYIQFIDDTVVVCMK